MIIECLNEEYDTTYKFGILTVIGDNKTFENIPVP
jgi:hypothetical protein